MIPYVMPVRTFFSRASRARCSLSSSRCVAFVEAALGASPVVPALESVLAGPVAVPPLKVVGFFFLL